MVVADGYLAVGLDRAALYAADGDAAHELVVIDTAHEHLEGGVLVALRGGDIIYNGVEERLEVGAGHVGRIARRAVAAGAEQRGAVELLVRAAEVHEELQHLVHDLVYALVGAVNLVEHKYDPVAELQCAAEHKAGLGHGALGGVHQQYDAVDHLQYALHLAAEVGVARGVNDVYLVVAVTHGGVLGQDSDAALALQVAGVHDALGHLLVLVEHACLLEHLVNQRGLAVVNVRDNGHISKMRFVHISITRQKVFTNLYSNTIL